MINSPSLREFTAEAMEQGAKCLWTLEAFFFTTDDL